MTLVWALQLGQWLCIIQTANNNELSVFLSYRVLFTCLTFKNFFSKVKNLLFKIGNEYKFYQPKAAGSVHYYILLFDVANMPTVSFSECMVEILD